MQRCLKEIFNSIKSTFVRSLGAHFTIKISTRTIMLKNVCSFPGCKINNDWEWLQVQSHSDKSCSEPGVRLIPSFYNKV